MHFAEDRTGRGRKRALGFQSRANIRAHLDFSLIATCFFVWHGSFCHILHRLNWKLELKSAIFGAHFELFFFMFALFWLICNIHIHWHWFAFCNLLKMRHTEMKECESWMKSISRLIFAFSLLQPSVSSWRCKLHMSERNRCFLKYSAAFGALNGWICASKVMHKIKMKEIALINILIFIPFDEKDLKISVSLSLSSCCDEREKMRRKKFESNSFSRSKLRKIIHFECARIICIWGEAMATTCHKRTHTHTHTD